MTQLKTYAYARSGDKGADVNIGVLAYGEKEYSFLKEALTEERVAHTFRALGSFTVKRYELPNLFAFNFLLQGVLFDGGGTTLRLDSQGKTLGQALLEMDLETV